MKEEPTMKRARLVFAVTAVLAACLLVPLTGSAAAPKDAVCPQDTHVFTGTTRDLTVPAGGVCQITGAHIGRDLILLDGAGADVSGLSVGRNVTFANFAGALLSNTSIGHDVVAAGEESGA